MQRLLLVFLFFTTQAFAQWTLDNSASSLNFMSVKNSQIAEVHSFDALSGSLVDNKASISVPLASVNTMIPIRNERMQSMLFDVANFPSATFSADIDAELTSLAVGQSKTADITGTISLHGKDVASVFSVRVTRASEKELVVATTKPYVLNAADFDLTGGVDALQKIAGLQVITYAVPVTFDVVFTQG